ncbi:Signal transduction protein containing GAF and PtsI domains [Streptomyces sp. Amel2xC10]|nr:Signal transduction protein containing GAF and PtsI domains [Streptomyces sp. Amel2xC10]
MLRAIVQRARSLLGTDIAYLSLHDPDRGDTYMRVTEGSVAARFQQLRLGMGEGLGGLVAQTARPYVTDDYFRDERFRHTATIDAGVRDEGLVAILGVPLTLGMNVSGRAAPGRVPRSEAGSSARPARSRLPVRACTPARSSPARPRPGSVRSEGPRW